MKNDLDNLEQKLAQLLQVTRQLRGENRQLQQALASALDDKRLSQEKIEKASARLEELLARIPESAQ